MVQAVRNIGLIWVRYSNHFSFLTFTLKKMSSGTLNSVSSLDGIPFATFRTFSLQIQEQSSLYGLKKSSIEN